jgi:hypothetical protein
VAFDGSSQLGNPLELNVRSLTNPHRSRSPAEENEMNNVFASILGVDYARLPPAVRHFHEVPRATYLGEATVRGSTSNFAAVIRAVFNFPAPAESTPVTIEVERTEDLDQWRRNFGGRKFSSSFERHLTSHLLSEVFGPFRFYFALSAENDRLNWHFQRWSLGPIPLPRALGPRSSNRFVGNRECGWKLSLLLSSALSHHRFAYLL